MRNLFTEMDDDESGCIGIDEFEKFLQDSRATAYFESLKLDVTDVRILFTLLDYDDDGSVNCDEFLQGCKKLGGESRSLDLAVLAYEVKWILHNFTRFADFVEQQFRVCNRNFTLTASADAPANS